MRLGIVSGHQVGYGQSLLVHAVQRDEQATERHVLIGERVRLPILSEAEEPEVECGYGFVPGLRAAVEDHCRRFGEVEVPAHHEVVFRVPDGEGGAAVGASRLPGLRAFGEAPGQEAEDVAAYLLRVARPSGFDESVEAVVTLELHVVEPLVQFLYGKRAFYHRSEGAPCACEYYQS